jgi:NDP-sugar pyrophosphorylase family protein
MSNQGVDECGRVSTAVILAGGKGTRLGPYTTVLPKPLLPIGNSAILEVLLGQLRQHGIHEVVLAVGYLAHLIQAVFGDGRRHDISIRYHLEEEPLGTAGALSGIEGLDEPFLMMNGDVLTSLDFNELYQAHVASGNAMTIATHRRIERSDYGVIHVRPEGTLAHVVGYEEKPEVHHLVSMGVYVVDPVALKYLQPGEPTDFPDLVLRLLAAGESVGSYCYDGFWLDIGRHDDYEKALKYVDIGGLLKAKLSLGPWASSPTTADWTATGTPPRRAVDLRAGASPRGRSVLS